MTFDGLHPPEADFTHPTTSTYKNWSVSRSIGGFGCAPSAPMAQGRFSVRANTEVYQDSITVNVSVLYKTKWVSPDIIVMPIARIKVGKEEPVRISLAQPDNPSIAPSGTEVRKGSATVTVPSQTTKVQLTVSMAGWYEGKEADVPGPALMTVPKALIIDLRTGECSTDKY